MNYKVKLAYMIIKRISIKISTLGKRTSTIILNLFKKIIIFSKQFKKKLFLVNLFLKFLKLFSI